VTKKFDCDCHGNIPVVALVRLLILLSPSYFSSLFIVLVISERPMPSACTHWFIVSYTLANYFQYFLSTFYHCPSAVWKTILCSSNMMFF